MAVNPYPGDPDFKYLALERDELAAQQAAPYDGKIDKWCPDPELGYVACKVKSTEGDKVTVDTPGGDKTFKKDEIQDMNPPKYEKNTDMANLTYLSEACILYNLRSRYGATLIYTYSGLFCVVINPYRRLPIYTPNVVSKYRGKRRTEMPPHLFAVADNAFQAMVQNRANQSCLITGESGAGKTENTKKVIAYFAMVAAAQAAEGEAAGGGKSECGSLEDQIVATNPVLEAWGNAKTVRNNNSSRFGKFIRIHFGTTGKIAGADIETYLLEKSRVTYQMPGIERNYHIFYWLMSGQYPEYAEKFLYTEDPAMYHFVNQGCLTVDNMDDKEEMRLVDVAFGDLGIVEDQKFAMYRVTAAVVTFGEMKFKQRPREEQADCDGTQEAEKIAFLIGVNCQDLLNALLKPKVKVGNDYVTKGQNINQVNFAVSALSKALFARMFGWLVWRVNKTLETSTKRQYFIGVLDIAGFEIFEFNTLEQLLINYTNECLQQFFNHHMFVLEQEEYKKEGIQWATVDFGMDLARTIELIEKPMGILSILEEQCMFPKADDKSLTAMLYDNHLGKHASFGKPKPKKGAKYEQHFELYHYAGTVAYNIEGWLFKNKDPLTDTVMQVIATSKEPMVAGFFAEEVAALEAAAAGKKGGGGKKKGGGGKTLSSQHKEQLGKLMHQLHSTSPHFVRCIIPNEVKTPGIIDAALVLHQLRCNGVMEGIRICRMGYPSRMLYAEFKQRYSILAPNAIPATGFVDGKEVTEKVLKALAMDDDKYKIGNTKVFFRAGVLGTLEEWRDERLGRIFTLFQAHVRGNLQRQNYQKLIDQRLALSIIQRNIRAWMKMRNWQWWKLFTLVKPMLSAAREAEEMEAKMKEFEKTMTEFKQCQDDKKTLEEQNSKFLQEKNDMFAELQSCQDCLGEAEERIEQLILERAENESLMKELEKDLEAAEEAGEAGAEKRKAMDDMLQKLKQNISDLELNVQKVEQERNAKENQIKVLNDDIGRLEENIAKLQKDKKSLEDQLKGQQDATTAEEDKVNHLNKLRQKLESNIDDLQDSLEREKKVRSDVEKAKRKVEGELKQTQEVVSELESIKSNLEDQGKRKDGEISGLNGRIEECEGQIAQANKKIKACQQTISELEEELENERGGRAKAEKARAELSRELDDLAQRLDEAGGQTAAQVDLNKKRENEIAKLRRDLDEAALAAEGQIAALRKKQQDAQNELGDQVEQLGKAKQKVEKERGALKSELEDAQGQLDTVNKRKAAAEKLAKSLEGQLSEANSRLDESSRRAQELEGAKARAGQENADLLRQLEEAESQANAFNKQKQNLARQLEECKGQLEEESRQRSKLSGENRNLQGDLDSLRDQFEEEQEGRADLQRLLAKANNEASTWRQKCESGEGGVRSEEMEDLKRKLSAKLAEAESAAEAAISKASNLEKAKNRMQGELEDLMIECERSQAVANQAEKRQRGFDKTVDDWKRKVADVQAELERSNADARNAATEMFRMKSTVEEANDTVAALRRENKNLSDEIRDITDQLGEGGRSVHELEKARKRLEMEKEELQSALEEAEAALEQEEAKVQRAQLDIGLIRQEIDRRLAEKDEEFDTTRKNMVRNLESVQASFEAEARGKSEAIRQKKKLESDINELEAALDAANRGRGEAEKNIKRFQNQARELGQAVEEEQRSRDEAREKYNQSERRANVLAGEVEELRTQLESSERARKGAEGELHEAADRVSELSTQAATLSAAKRKLETDVQAMQTDLEDQAGELKGAEEAAKKAMADASRLAEELRQEQEHGSHIEKMRRTLEGQVKELQSRLDEAEASALKGGKRMIQKLEQRVRELEVELDNEQRRHAETQKGIRKQDRRVKELAFQADEDRKGQERMTEMIDKLQQKIKTYKRQVEEAEEVAAVNLAKYRKVQHELEEAEERADMAENTLAKLRAKNRSSASVGPKPAQ